MASFSRNVCSPCDSGRLQAPAPTIRRGKPSKPTAFSHPLLALSLKGHTEPLTDVVVAPSGLMVATSSLDRTIRVFRLDLVERRRKLSQPPFVRVNMELDHASALAFAPTSRALALASADSRHVEVLALSNTDGAAGLSATERNTFVTPHGDAVRDLLWTSTSVGPVLLTAVCGDDTSFRLWTPRGDVVDAAKTNQVRNFGLHASADGRLLAASTFAADVKLWTAVPSKRTATSPSKARQVATLAGGHTTSVTAVAFPPLLQPAGKAVDHFDDDDRCTLVATGAKDGSWRVWRCQSEQRAPARGCAPRSHSVALCRQGWGGRCAGRRRVWRAWRQDRPPGPDGGRQGARPGTRACVRAC